MEGAIAKAREIAERTPRSFMPHQFDNPANPHVHPHHGARDPARAWMANPSTPSWRRSAPAARSAAWGARCESCYPECRVIAVEPESCATISRGERGPDEDSGHRRGLRAQELRPERGDEVRTVTDEHAYRTKLELARREGLLAGISAGANVAVALEVARELGEGKNVVTVLCDTGERYFSLDEYFNP